MSVRLWRITVEFCTSVTCTSCYIHFSECKLMLAVQCRTHENALPLLDEVEWAGIQHNYRQVL